MKTPLSILSVVALLAWGGELRAQQTQATAGEDDDPNRKICKPIVVTGTRMSKRVCHTKAQWDEMERATRSRMREIDNQKIPVDGDSGGTSAGFGDTGGTSPGF
ncbi:MAG: hypothetical protein QM599_07215 [Pseudoxanthomonas sp.]